MAIANAEKLNSGYIIRPLSFFKDELSHTAEKVRAYLYSFGSTDEGVSVGYTALSDKLSVSRTSIWRATSNKKVRQAFDIEREGGKVTHYTYNQETQKEFSVRTELFFYTEEFVICGKVRRLTDSEVNVLSLIYTFTRYEKAGKFTGNYADMGRMLHIDYFTVLRAVSALFSAGLIFRPRKAKNDKAKSEYVANMKRIRALEKLNKKKEKESATVSQGEAKRIKELDERAERERFYAQRKERAEAMRDKAMEKANKNPRFRELAVELSKMEFSLAKAEVYAPLTLPALQSEKVALLAERKQVLESMGMTEEMLSVHYACDKCSDTGFLPNGKPCGCYKHLKGGG